MTSGRLSYKVELDGHRYFDTSELIRVYGELKVVTQPIVSSLKGASDTASNTLLKVLHQMELMQKKMDAQSEELAEIRKQLEERPLLPAPVHQERIVTSSIDAEKPRHSLSSQMAQLKETLEKEQSEKLKKRRVARV